MYVELEALKDRRLLLLLALLALLAFFFWPKGGEESTNVFEKAVEVCVEAMGRPVEGAALFAGPVEAYTDERGCAPVPPAETLTVRKEGFRPYSGPFKGRVELEPLEREILVRAPPEAVVRLERNGEVLWEGKDGDSFVLVFSPLAEGGGRVFWKGVVAKMYVGGEVKAERPLEKNTVVLAFQRERLSFTSDRVAVFVETNSAFDEAVLAVEEGENLVAVERGMPPFYLTLPPAHYRFTALLKLEGRPVAWGEREADTGIENVVRVEAGRGIESLPVRVHVPSPGTLYVLEGNRVIEMREVNGSALLEVPQEADLLFLSHDGKVVGLLPAEEEVNFEPTPMALLSGILKLGEEPLAGVTVYASVRGIRVGEIVTNREGVFLLPLPRGLSYRVCGEYEGMKACKEVFLRDDTRVELRIGKALREVRFLLDGEPVEGSVEALGKRYDIVGGVARLPEGRYRARVHVDGQTFTVIISGDVVELSTGQASNATVLSIYAPPGAVSSIISPSGHIIRTIVHEGEASLVLPSGLYRVLTLYGSIKSSLVRGGGEVNHILPEGNLFPVTVKGKGRAVLVSRQGTFPFLVEGTITLLLLPGNYILRAGERSYALSVPEQEEVDLAPAEPPKVEVNITTPSGVPVKQMERGKKYRLHITLRAEKSVKVRLMGAVTDELEVGAGESHHVYEFTAKGRPLVIEVGGKRREFPLPTGPYEIRCLFGVCFGSWVDREYHWRIENHTRYTLTYVDPWGNKHALGGSYEGKASLFEAAGVLRHTLLKGGEELVSFEDVVMEGAVPIELRAEPTSLPPAPTTLRVWARSSVPLDHINVVLEGSCGPRYSVLSVERAEEGNGYMASAKIRVWNTGNCERVVLKAVSPPLAGPAELALSVAPAILRLEAAEESFRDKTQLMLSNSLPVAVVARLSVTSSCAFSLPTSVVVPPGGSAEVELEALSCDRDANVHVEAVAYVEETEVARAELNLTYRSGKDCLQVEPVKNIVYGKGAVVFRLKNVCSGPIQVVEGPEGWNPVVGLLEPGGWRELRRVVEGGGSETVTVKYSTGITTREQSFTLEWFDVVEGIELRLSVPGNIEDMLRESGKVEVSGSLPFNLEKVRLRLEGCDGIGLVTSRSGNVVYIWPEVRDELFSTRFTDCNLHVSARVRVGDKTYYLGRKEEGLYWEPSVAPFLDCKLEGRRLRVVVGLEYDREVGLTGVLRVEGGLLKEGEFWRKGLEKTFEVAPNRPAIFDLVLEGGKEYTVRALIGEIWEDSCAVKTGAEDIGFDHAALPDLTIETKSFNLTDSAGNPIGTDLKPIPVIPPSKLVNDVEVYWRAVKEGGAPPALVFYEDKLEELKQAVTEDKDVGQVIEDLKNAAKGVTPDCAWLKNASYTDVVERKEEFVDCCKRNGIEAYCRDVARYAEKVTGLPLWYINEEGLHRALFNAETGDITLTSTDDSFALFGKYIDGFLKLYGGELEDAKGQYPLKIEGESAYLADTYFFALEGSCTVPQEAFRTKCGNRVCGLVTKGALEVSGTCILYLDPSFKQKVEIEGESRVKLVTKLSKEAIRAMVEELRLLGKEEGDVLYLVLDPSLFVRNIEAREAVINGVRKSTEAVEVPIGGCVLPATETGEGAKGYPAGSLVVIHSSTLEDWDLGVPKGWVPLICEDGQWKTFSDVKIFLEEAKRAGKLDELLDHGAPTAENGVVVLEVSFDKLKKEECELIGQYTKRVRWVPVLKDPTDFICIMDPMGACFVEGEGIWLDVGEKIVKNNTLYRCEKDGWAKENVQIYTIEGEGKRGWIALEEAPNDTLPERALVQWEGEEKAKEIEFPTSGHYWIKGNGILWHDTRYTRRIKLKDDGTWVWQEVSPKGAPENGYIAYVTHNGEPVEVPFAVFYAGSYYAIMHKKDGTDPALYYTPTDKSCSESKDKIGETCTYERLNWNEDFVKVEIEGPADRTKRALDAYFNGGGISEKDRAVAVGLARWKELKKSVRVESDSWFITVKGDYRDDTLVPVIVNKSNKHLIQGRMLPRVGELEDLLSGKLYHVNDKTLLDDLSERGVHIVIPHITFSEDPVVFIKTKDLPQGVKPLAESVGDNVYKCKRSELSLCLDVFGFWTLRWEDDTLKGLDCSAESVGGYKVEKLERKELDAYTLWSAVLDPRLICDDIPKAEVDYWPNPIVPALGISAALGWEYLWACFMNEVDDCEKRYNFLELPITLEHRGIRAGYSQGWVPYHS